MFLLALVRVPTPPTAPLFFATPEDFRKWLREHHATERELVVGFYKRGSGKPSITWPESVDEALCVGWIDGVRHSLGPDSYTIRFTPRQPVSTWSAVNIRRMQELIAQERVLPEGLLAFERRAPEKSGIYAYEQRGLAKLDPEAEERFRGNARAWEYFQSRAPGYRRTAIWWVVSAKREETRRKRLDELIELSAKGATLPGLTR